MNKYIISLAEQSWAKIIVFAVIAVGVYYATLFNNGESLDASFKQAQTQLVDAEKSLKATRDAIANADRFEKEVKEAIENFNRVIDFMPEKLNSAEMTTIASELSGRAGTRLMKTEPKEQNSKVEFYDTTKLAFTLEGTFSQILMFLSSLSKVPKLMTFDKVDLDVVQNSADIENPKLTFSGLLVGYKYIKPKLTDEKSPNAAGATGTNPGGAPGNGAGYSGANPAAPGAK